MFPINGDGLDNFHIKSLVFKSYSGSMFAICCQFDCGSPCARARVFFKTHTLYARRQFVDTTKNSKQFELTFYRPHTNTVRIFSRLFFCLFCTLIHGKIRTVLRCVKKVITFCSNDISIDFYCFEYIECINR